jgi:hypothetical protein
MIGLEYNMPPKKAMGSSIMSLVNETIPKTKGRPKKTDKSEEEVKQMKEEAIPKATAFVTRMIEAKKAKKEKRTLNLDLPIEPTIPEPVTPPQRSEPMDIPAPVKIKKEPKITQRVIHEEESEEEIIEEVIVKKKKKPIIRRRIIYESSSEEEEEEVKPKRSGKRREVADPIQSMTQSEIQNEMRKIQMEMLSKSLFG